MSGIIVVTPTSDLSDLRLEKTPNGHIVSPWFTYDYKHYHSGPVYEIGSHFHSVRFSSIAAFARALNIRPDQVVVTERTDQTSGGKDWRLGTSFPCELPKPKTPTLAAPKQTAPDAIDI